MGKFNINFKFIFHIIGLILIIEGIFMFLTFLVSVYYKETDEIQILGSTLITFLTGALIFMITKNHSKEFYIKESFLLVSLTWVIISLFGSLPYLLTLSIHNFTDALFESVSGFTTTGSSILEDIEALPPSILFWRSETHWIGGIGIIVMFIALYPSLRIGKIYLFNAEASVVVEDKLYPSISAITRRLIMIYLGLTFTEIILLKISGMSLFDSVCHSFATIATGGFSTKNASIGYYSAKIQYIIGIFMILSAVNFNIYLMILKKKFSNIAKNDELKWYLGILFTTIFIVTAVLIFKEKFNFEKAFRLAFFNVSSLMTATGFATTDYLKWTPLAYIFIVLVMFIGASSGSTGGGVKVIRYVIVFKKLRNIIKEILHPNLVSSITINNHVVDNSLIIRVFTFIILYFFFVIAGSLILIFTGVDPITSFGSALTAMGGMGPGLGFTGPAGNFSAIPTIGKFTLIALMIIGRLEIFSVITIFSRNFWRP